MPRKRKLSAHLARLNALREKGSSDVGPPPAGSRDDGSETDGSQTVLTDDDSYWPREDEIETADLADNDLHGLALKWVPDSRRKRKAPHIGVSRWTTWRRQSAIEKRAKSMAGNKNLFEFWKAQRPSDQTMPVVEAQQQSMDREDQQDVHRRKALQILEDTFHIDAPNRSFEQALKTTSKCDFLRLICVHRYLKAIQNEQPAVRSSEEVASGVYPEMNKERRGRNIRIWADFFMEHHRLPDINQGCHVKIRSIIFTSKMNRISRKYYDPDKSQIKYISDIVCEDNYNYAECDFLKELVGGNYYKFSEESN